MAVTVSTAGPYYSSGPISFSSLRSTFKEVSTGSLKASEIRRNTSTTEVNPIVPDSTENSNISSSVNLKLSQFRNSIKYYYITQTGTDTNFDIDSQNWNNNLYRNIRKWIYMTGTFGSNSVSSAAASIDATVYNLTIDVSGSIYGAGGVGGTLSSISGENGGNALSISPPNSNNIVVYVRSSAKIYGGGGGGEKGSTGAAGSSGICYSYSEVTERYTTGNRCRSCPDCDPGWYRVDCYQREGQCDWRGQFRKSVCERKVTVGTPYDVSGAPGGEGGDGAAGRGYNNFSGSLIGLPGVEGTTGGCPTYGGTGETGETGGDGGDWGSDGKNTKNAGSPGTAGKAISGSNYTVTGTINLDTIKGAYLAQ